MINVHGLRRNVKNVVKNYSDAQVKVREATSNDPWGPSGTLMSEIADLTYNMVAFSEIMQVIWKRLNDHGKNWKHVYKALVLLEYLIKTGSDKVTQQCKENIFAIQTLKDFQYFEESKDQGVNVREKAKQLVALLKDDERLKNERVRALKARERFARSSSYIRQENLQQFGSSELSGGSYDEEAMSPSAMSLSELEHARPQTIGEEELQLQLALAMSKEEAEQMERIKRNDDLRLQMALSESEEVAKMSGSAPCEQSPQQSASAMDDLLGLSLESQQGRTPLMDPWGVPLNLPQPESNNLDIWNNSNALSRQNHNSAANDPWSPASENGMENRGSNEAFLQNSDASYNAFDMSGMRKSVSADVCARDGGKSLDVLLSAESSLIHLDPAAPRVKNTGNPFQAAKPSPLSINEIRARSSPQPFAANPPENTFTMPTMSLPSSNTMFTRSPYTNQNTVPQNPFM